MTRDPFSAAAISADVEVYQASHEPVRRGEAVKHALDTFSAEEVDDLGGMHPDHELAPYYLTWRRLQRERAKRIARSLIQTESVTSGSATTRAVGGIGVQGAARPADPRGGVSVHPAPPAQYKPSTPDRAIALRLLRSVPEPLTKTRVARTLQWTEDQARDWLRLFASKGVLVVRRGRNGGHFWAKKDEGE